jgi:hypothetical protein
MSRTAFTVPITGTIVIDGDYMTITISESIVTLRIEGSEARVRMKLHLGPGRTMFDLVLEAARDFVDKYGIAEFSAADLYRLAREKHPELHLRRDSWGAHVAGSAPNHPSYTRFTAQRSYFRYLGKGKYRFDETLTQLGSHEKRA